MNKSDIFIRGLLGIKFKDYGNNYLVTNVMPPDKICVTYEGVCEDTSLLVHEDLLEIIIKDDKYFLIFNAKEWVCDIDLFLNGKYRSMSFNAKQTIIDCFSEGKNKKSITSVFYPTLNDIKKLSAYLNYELSDSVDIFSKPTLKEEIIDEL
jgi:hypothetical protein